MKITRVEAFQIETPRYYGKISGHAIVKIYVENGLVGLGEASDSRAANLSSLTKRYNQLLVGCDTIRIVEINEMLRQENFGSTISNAHLVLAIDLALYDLNGKAQGVPACMLLGGWKGACTIFNVACVASGPIYVRRLFALAEAAGLECLIGTDQESTLGTSAQVPVGVSMPNLNLPCDPMGPVLYTTSPAKKRIHAEGSYLYPPEGPGLGIELDEDKMKQMTIVSA